MSWSASAGGNKAHMRGEIMKQFDNALAGYSRCQEPEETMRQAVGVMLLAAINANPDGNFAITCSGSVSINPKNDRLACTMAMKLLWAP